MALNFDRTNVSPSNWQEMLIPNTCAYYNYTTLAIGMIALVELGQGEITKANVYPIALEMLKNQMGNPWTQAEIIHAVALHVGYKFWFS